MKKLIYILCLLNCMCIVAQEFTYKRVYWVNLKMNLSMSGSIAVDQENKTMTIFGDDKKYPPRIFNEVNITGEPDTRLEVRSSEGDLKFRMYFSPYKNEENIEETHILNYTTMDTFTNEKNQYLYYLTRTK